VGNNPANSIDPLGLDNIKVYEDASDLINSGCTLNGMAMPCGMVNNAIWSGAAARCPNDDCFGIKATQGPGGSTEIQQWVPGHLVTINGTLPGGGAAIVEFYFEGGWETVGLQIPGIEFTQSSPTTSTFVSQYGFWQTVGKFGQAGFRWDPLDPFHPGQFDLRDSRTFCSAHVDIDKTSGRTPGQPTTGNAHLDTVNPYGGTYSILLGPGSLVLTFLGHEALDVIGGGLYPGAQACK
jgi:hypothetical protein